MLGGVAYDLAKQLPMRLHMRVVIRYALRRAKRRLLAKLKLFNPSYSISLAAFIISASGVIYSGLFYSGLNIDIVCFSNAPDYIGFAVAGLNYFMLYITVGLFFSLRALLRGAFVPRVDVAVRWAKLLGYSYAVVPPDFFWEKQRDKWDRKYPIHNISRYSRGRIASLAAFLTSSMVLFTSIFLAISPYILGSSILLSDPDHWSYESGLRYSPICVKSADGYLPNGSKQCEHKAFLVGGTAGYLFFRFHGRTVVVKRDAVSQIQDDRLYGVGRDDWLRRTLRAMK